MNVTIVMSVCNGNQQVMLEVKHNKLYVKCTNNQEIAHSVASHQGLTCYRISLIACYFILCFLSSLSQGQNV